MAEKSFGVKEINLIGASGTPTIESPNNLNLNAVNVAISTNVSIGGTLSVTGNVSVGGTLTYEDVTNIDAIGIVTARSGIKVLAGGANVVGVVTATSFDGDLAASNLTGPLPAISGANLTNLPSQDPTNADIQGMWTVGGGLSGYTFTGPGVESSQTNPTLYLVRGQRYRFVNSTGSSHPFAFRVSSGGSAYTDGISGSQSGTQDFSVQFDAPAALVYQCTIHSGMVGIIYIVGNSLNGGGNDRVLTSTGGQGIVGESNLSFDGSTLDIDAGSSDEKIKLYGSAPYIRFVEGSTNKAYVQWQPDGFLALQNEEDSSRLRIKDTLDFTTGDGTYHTVWHAGNDGPSSGLNADLLDGQEGSYYTNAANLSGTLPAISGANLTNLPSPDPTNSDIQGMWTVGGGLSGYTFTGPGVESSQTNPTLYLVRGQRYRFVNTASSHPFEFRVSSGGSAYTDGISGSQTGTQDFSVQFDAPAVLVYQCIYHSSMVGIIYITGNSLVSGGNNRVLTSTGGQGIVGESNLIFDGSTLTVSGRKVLSDGSTRGIVNAADYGLDSSKTDGTNVSAINDAITALGTDGGTILFPGGMFYLNATISLGNSNNSIRFVGLGQQNYGGGSDSGGTVLRRDQNNEFFNITNSRAIHFIGITFKGGAANGGGGNAGVSGGTGAITVSANAGCQGHLYENLVFHGIKNCLTLNGLSDSIISGCRFRLPPTDEGTGQFIKLDDNGGERLDQIRIENCVGDGSPDGSALNSVVDGIYISGHANTIFVTNCSFIRLNRPYYTDGSWTGEFLYFQNAEAERASGDAGFLFSSGGNNDDGNFITLDNCFSSTCENNGITLAGNLDASVNITNCNVRGNKNHGILVDSDGGNTSIVNPIVCGNNSNNSGGHHGIVIGANVSDVYIAGGRCGGNVSMTGNGNQAYGIRIDGASHDNIRIIGTNCTGNATGGIDASLSGSGNKIQFNSGSTLSVNTN